MNRKAYASILAVALLALSFLTSCSSSSEPAPPVISIAATSGTPQTATVGTAFAALVATVTTGGTPTSGVTVTFTAPATGASGTFAGGVNTATTNASGVATSVVFTANTTAGAYTVTASATGTSTSASFSLTNTVPSTNSSYSFNLTGLNWDYGAFYALAGAVTIDANGTVLAGEQDYNDAFLLTSPEPSGDRITGGTLTVDSTTGQGTLTLVTNNPALGMFGIENLGVQFANTNHALVVQFDGTATSSGSMDLQTLTSPLSGGYAFTLSGVGGNNPTFDSVVAGGVFSISGESIQNGLLDVDDAGSVTLGTPFSGTISPPDSFGRGTITGTGIASTINYYIVGPEAIRIIDVDYSDSFVGSAFGQGEGTFDDESLGSSVFGVESNSYGLLYAAAGMFATVPGSGTFQGVADNDEDGVVVSGVAISGNYSIASNGYGSLTISSENLGDVSALGIYMTDPNLNLNDPNNTTSGLGGALVVDRDLNVNGTGVLIPQTDTSPDSFAGNYAFGAQGYSLSNAFGWEFDFVGQVSVTNAVLSGTGLVSDPFAIFSTSPANYSGVPFAGTATPDGTNPGRFTIPLNIMAVAGSPTDFQVVIYQASGGQLFWMDEDNLSLFFGPLEQQGSLTELHAAKKAGATSKPKRKQ